MLLFIPSVTHYSLPFFNFKTSHVIVYRRVSENICTALRNFKTSHVIVYLMQLFQCQSSISYFKTSHVIVYPVSTFNQVPVISFQNISCYCLSVPGCNARERITISKHLMLLFINRSNWISNRRRKISKHLMLLFITSMMFGKLANIGFQNISCYCLSTPPCINSTSFHISKHLMLLFIEYTWNLTRFLFDYFKTSHVIVYLF